MASPAALQDGPGGQKQGQSHPPSRIAVRAMPFFCAEDPFAAWTPKAHGRAGGAAGLPSAHPPLQLRETTPRRWRWSVVSPYPADQTPLTQRAALEAPGSRSHNAQQPSRPPRGNQSRVILPSPAFKLTPTTCPVTHTIPPKVIPEK